MVISLLSFHKPGIQVEVDRFFKFCSLDSEHIITYTKSAFSQSRQKLKAEAFVSLRDRQLQYFDENTPIKNTWMDLRIVAIDGSSLNLPQVPCLTQHFGIFKNQSATTGTGAKISVAYDVCNHLILDGLITPTESSEQEMARKHLSKLKPWHDLLLFDRGYPSIELAMELAQKGFKFCFRLSTGWKEAHALLEKYGSMDMDWHLNKGRRYKIGEGKEAYLKEDICFRLVKIILDSGEVEVLLTNLSDRSLYPTKVFKGLYHMRWCVEECYKRIKQVDQIEFFSGRTVKAIEQDFHARIILLNIAAMIETGLMDKKVPKNR